MSPFQPLVSDPFGFAGNTFDILDSTVGSVQAGANEAIYYRVTRGGQVLATKIAIRVLAQAGNISVGVYSSSGSGRSAVPGVLKATSGAVACPAVGYAEVALVTPTTVSQGDWLAWSADGVVAQLNGFNTGGATNNISQGLGARSTAVAHPLQNPAANLNVLEGRIVYMLAIP